MLTWLEPLVVEGAAHGADELRRDPVGAERAHVVPERAVDHGLARVETDAPEALAERPRAGEAGGDAVVVPVDQRRDVDLGVVDVGERRRRRDGVAAVRGDERVRHRADALAAPPGRLRVGAHADGAGDVGGVPVAGLHPVVVEARREEEDRLAARGVDDAAHVGADERAPREHAEVHGLQVGEEGVVALDRQHRLPPRQLVAVVERAHVELVPAVHPHPLVTFRDVAPRAQPQDGQRLVHPPEDRAVGLLEDLHGHAGVQVLGLEHALGAVEVGVGVVALPQPVDGEGEDLWCQT